VRQIIDKFGRIDILVNATSAPLKIASLEEKKWADFSGHLDVQFKSAVVFTKLILPYMKKQKWGRIINILSTGIIGQPPSNLSDYISAKYAAWGLTKCLAKELGRFNITVNAVSPNFIKNKFSSVFPEKMAELVASQTPGGKLATPQDVADKVLFLASEKASKINGENIIVSGG
jgi:3-oxoacyl-[acyl-carrier protein] reductase